MSATNFKARLQELAQLESNRNGTNFPAISALALVTAELVLSQLPKACLEDCMLYAESGRGGVQAEWWVPEPYGMEVVFLPDGTVETFLSALEDDDALLQEQVSMTDALNFIRRNHPKGMVI